MKLSIQTKLLLMTILLVGVTTIGISSAYYARTSFSSWQRPGNPPNYPKWPPENFPLNTTRG